MRESKAAAEVAALEGLMSSPDTQECKRIFQESLGCGFDSQQTIEDRTVIINRPQPQLSHPVTSLSLPNLEPLVPSNGVFSCSQQAKLFANLQATPDFQTLAPHSTGTSSRDTVHALLDALHPREDSRTEIINVQSVVHPVLNESSERIPVSCAHGLVASVGLAGQKMEDFISPLDGSYGSNLSPTQENDPSVYIRLQQELVAMGPNSQNSSPGLTSTKAGPATNNGSLPSAQDTEVTYAVNDTGHLTLDYQLPPPSLSLHNSFDQAEAGDTPGTKFGPHHFSEKPFHPETPAQARLAIGNLGTVMRPSQMFAETQPSPGSRNRHLHLPSSSRPSPDLFNQYHSPKQPTSSPLARRTVKKHLQKVESLDVYSSPEPSQMQQDGHQTAITRRQPSGCANLLKNTGDESPIPGRLVHHITPEPSNVYTTLQESQERRKEKEILMDHGDESSYDGFSDEDDKSTRRAKRIKEKAAKELAIIGTSTPGSVGKDFVEVPSTSHTRRRSEAEDYEAQCSGFDARDTQPDATILDSQSAPVESASSLTNKTSRIENTHESSHSEAKVSHHRHDADADLVFYEEACQNNSSGQLPALENTEHSQATESDGEDSRSPKRSTTLNEGAFEVVELRTPAVQKKLPYVDEDDVIPETSPSEPHLQRFGNIVVQTPPLLAAGEAEEGFNPFTQDTEFENLLKSPSPDRRILSRISKNVASNMTADSRDVLEANLKSKITEELASDLNSFIVDQLESGLEMKSTPKHATLETASEYVTAPTGLSLASHQVSEVQTDLGLDNVDHGTHGADKELMPEIGFQASQINPIEDVVISGEAKGPRTELQQFEMEAMKDIPLAHSSPLKESMNMVPRVIKHPTLREADVTPGNGRPKPPAAKRTRPSSHPSTKSSKQTNASSENMVDLNSDAVAAEPSAILPNRLRSAAQLRGSSRSLRRLLEDTNAAPSTPVPSNNATAPKVQRLPRSSRRSSTNSSENARSTEPDGAITPTLSTRRRTLSNQLVEQGIFEGMAFSVTYSATLEDEKQHVLEMIRNNGGRVLEKGFDELFDVNTLQRSSFARNNESFSVCTSSDLTLTAAARRVGFACLIADYHSRRVKFMQALALGLPCISGRWIEHCVARKEILDWEQYHLAAGESSFLGGAIRSRNLHSYPAETASFTNRFELRPRLLTGKSILVITGKGKAEERRKPYFFLTQALGACRVKRVQNNHEARMFLLKAEANQEVWDWVYVDENEEEAEKMIFGVQEAQPKKRKRSSKVSEIVVNTAPPIKKVRIVSDEYVIQSLILGKFIEE